MAKRSDPAKIQLWQQRLERFTQAQMSVPDFCASEGVSAPNFYYWRRRLSPPPLPFPDPAAPSFLPVQLLADAAPLELVLPTGARLRIGPDCDPQLLHAVLQLLGVLPY